MEKNLLVEIFLFASVFFGNKKDIFSCTFDLSGWVGDKIFFTWPISGNKTTFCFGPGVSLDFFHKSFCQENSICLNLVSATSVFGLDHSKVSNLVSIYKFLCKKTIWFHTINFYYVYLVCISCCYWSNNHDCKSSHKEILYTAP